MNSIIQRSLFSLARPAQLAALMLTATFALLYVPTLWDLAQGIWRTDDQAHGPMILAIGLWLLYRAWPNTLKVCGWHTAEQPPSPSMTGLAAGSLILLTGLLLYVVGRSQSIPFMELGSMVWVLAGTYALVLGPRALRAVWFPLLFMCFMVPMPGLVIATVTMPMKIAVSYMAETVLFALNYPIARSGVLLQIGPYQLMVADACAGLQTLFTLEAMGLLYLNLLRHESLLRNVFLAVSIIPIAFTANVIRVMVLTLVTYYWGDAAGQGFLHGFAGMVLFVSALLLIMALDSMLRLLNKIRTGPDAGALT